MQGIKDKNRKIYASIFLLGYLSFVLLSITHFHSFCLSNSDTIVQFTNTSAVKTIDDGQGDCPVCHLYSTVSFTPIQAVASFVFTVEGKISSFSETSCQNKFNDSQYLRAPPSLISHSV